MPTKTSKRHMEQRARTYDRITTTIDKGGANLVKVLAIKENVSQAEIIRRAILARAGLNLLPWPGPLAELATVKDQRDAVVAIHRLQMHECAEEITEHLLEELAAEPPSKAYMVQADDLADAELALAKLTQGELKLTGRDVGTLRRLLANIEPQNIE